MKLNSVRFKMSLLHTAIMGVILIVFSCVLYYISNKAYRQIDDGLRIKAGAVLTSIRFFLKQAGTSGPEAVAEAAAKTIAMKSEGFPGTGLRKMAEDWQRMSEALDLDRDYIHFFSSDGRINAGSRNLDDNLRGMFMDDLNMASRKTTFRTVTQPHGVIRVVTYPVMLGEGSPYFIQVGVSQGPIMHQLRNWFYAFVISSPVILFLTVYMTRKQALRIMRPVHAITAMANTITHQDLSARIKTAHFDSDMALLINSFNDMIARLEQSFKHIEEFSHQVAHELKTPLTIIKGEAELLLRKERSVQEYQQTLKIIQEESEHVLRTIEDLLLLSKLDYQTDVFQFEEFNLVEFIRELCEQSKILADGTGIEVSGPGERENGITVRADKVHLRRLFFNLLDNAIKFSPPHGRVGVCVSRPQPGRVAVTVSDSGPGISPEDMKRIHEKSFNARTLGNGLGLNIAWTIARMHRGDIGVISRLGEGAAFTVNLPSVN